MADEVRHAEDAAEIKQRAVAYDEVRHAEDAAEIKQRAGVAADITQRAVAYDEVMNPEDAAEIKRAAASERSDPGEWRYDLHANVPAAINWANLEPTCTPGSIIFNIRDNGQVWTYTFLSGLLPAELRSWHANLWNNVPAAVAYANQFPLSEPSTIVFNIRDNGQVWTFDLS